MTVNNNQYVTAGKLKASRCLHELVADETAPGTGIDADRFWASLADFVDNSRETRELLNDIGYLAIRDPMETAVQFGSRTFDTNYVNWTVGNGFVLLVGFDNPETDSAAKARVQSYFPGPDVHVIEMLSSWASGGGVHCHTNDQPAP